MAIGARSEAGVSRAVAHFCRAALPHLKKTEGSIINIGTTSLSSLPPGIEGGAQ